MDVIPSQFSGGGQKGDFKWMIESGEYADALFIFNDNEEAFRSFTDGCQVGGGNAVIRPYRGIKYCRPPAAGIPTGSLGKGGYGSLQAPLAAGGGTCQNIIDDAISLIKELLASAKPPYQQIYYSADAAGNLDSSIFKDKLGDDVKIYIIDQIKKLAEPNTQP